MSNWVDEKDIKAARRANLHGFLCRNHPDAVEKEGNSLRLKCNHSISIKEGYSGWYDFATRDSGNAIELLTDYFDYTFQDAVTALCNDMGIGSSATTSQIAQTQQPRPKPEQLQPEHNTPMVIPQPLQGQYKQLYAYLTQTRCIPAATVQRLINDGILYQEKDHANMVFINPSHTFFEIRGTNTYKPFHQVNFSPDASADFWWFKAAGQNTDPTVAYVCEAAIDAISLYLIHKASGTKENGLYCAIGGVANQQRIDRIKQGMAAAGMQTIIAVDNDDAGSKCRERNSDCPYLIPAGKDWNEDWQNAVKKG